MAEREPMTQTINLNDAQRDFGLLVGKVSKKETRVVAEAIAEMREEERNKRLPSHQ